MRTGFIAIVGRPNVGKSTLLNHLVGQKISITSSKAQTTRHRITGIVTEADAQYIFVDTPGFQTRHGSALNRTMNRTVRQSLMDVDVVLYVVEALRYLREDREVLPLLPKETPVFLVVNKIDRVPEKDKLLPFIAEVSEEFPFAEVIPLSAEKGIQLKTLLGAIRPRLPEGEPLFGEDEITEKSERFLAAELLREKVFRLLGDELPYSIAVEIDEFKEEGGLRRIHASIIVDRDNQKGIVIGKKGEKLKKIASQARLEMERLFDGRVFLEVFVKVRSGWADDARILKSLGYEEG